MASSMYISGLASGLDWTSMISQLVAVQRNPIVLVERSQSALSDKKSAWSEVNTKLLSLKTAATALSSSDDFDVFKASATLSGSGSDMEDLLSYAVGTGASEGSYNVTVNKLATAQKLTSAQFTSSSEDLGISGDLTINGQTVTVATTDSLSDIQSKINALNSGDNPLGVTASILKISDSEYRLTLTSKTTGAAGFTYTDGTGSLSMTQTVAGQDAEIEVDGFTITRSTNTITDVIAGVTLNLVGADENATVTLNIGRDTDGVKQKIQAFVDAYNDVMSYIAEQNTAAEDDDDNPALYADTSLQTIKSTLRRIILSGVDGLDSTLDHLSLIGVNIDTNGKLSINDKTLDKYLESNFNDVVNLFVAHGSSSSSDLTYVYSGANTAAGDYQVEITQVAAKASVTGSDFAGTLGSDVTLTLTGSSGTAQTITLSAGYDLDDIVNAINGGNTLGVVAENDGGKLKLTSEAYGTPGNFTVSGIDGTLGIADGTYAGVDVAGRIRVEGSTEWMTMTGKGRLLTGDDGQAVDGLVISYTGTSTGTFDFSYIAGVAQKLDNALYSMTDSVDGYVAGKKNSLQSQIDKLDKKIEAMEERLTKYQEALTAKFTAMETALNTLQKTQSWLENQINSLTNS